MTTEHNLKPDVAVAVAAVMRSHKQVRGSLSNGCGGFCAEGAVMEAYRLTTGKGRWTKDGTWRDDETGDATAGRITSTVARWACGGRWGAPAILRESGAWTPLVQLNDSLDLRVAMTLEEMADILDPPSAHCLAVRPKPVALVLGPPADAAAPAPSPAPAYVLDPVKVQA